MFYVTVLFVLVSICLVLKWYCRPNLSGLIVELPNGLKVWALSAFEAKVLFKQLFESNEYFQHGLTLSDGDCVFDLGANIGLFSVLVMQKKKNLRVFAFEPIPCLYQMALKNLETNSGESSKASVFPIGISDKTDRVTFRFDPTTSFQASMCLDQVRSIADRNPLLWARAFISDSVALGLVSRSVGDLLHKVFQIPVLNVFLLMLMLLPSLWNEKMYSLKVECPVRSLSEVIEEQKVERIDLLKIDVEGAELAVLRGILDKDWIKIKQVVVEVHDIDDRVNKILLLLQSKGFRPVVQKGFGHILKLLRVSMIHALRVHDTS